MDGATQRQSLTTLLLAFTLVY